MLPSPLSPSAAVELRTLLLLLVLVLLWLLLSLLWLLLSLLWLLWWWCESTSRRSLSRVIEVPTLIGRDSDGRDGDGRGRGGQGGCL